MKAISTNQSSLFFNAAPAGSSTSTWSAPFLAEARCREASSKRVTRRPLAYVDETAATWHEPIARIALGLAVLSAYAATIWQFSRF